MFSPIYAIFVEQIGGDILDAGLASMTFGFKVLFMLMGSLTFLSGIYIWHLDRREL